MAKADFWKKDWFLGLVVAVVLLLFGGLWFAGVERTAYDWGVRASSRAPSDKVAVIAIDEASIRNIGRWPWSRDVLAKRSGSRARAQAKVSGNPMIGREPQLDPGLAFVNKMLDLFPKPSVEGE